MRNLKITVEYDGTDFSGWQRQPQNPHQKTVQGELERMLNQLLQEPIEVTAAGRTDAGVHARGQVANFVTNSAMGGGRLHYSLNCLLPDTIKITALEEAAIDFSARFDVSARVYRYFMITEPSALLSRFAGLYRYGFDTAKMQACADMILGKHNFTSFSKAGAQTKTRICTITRARWIKRSGKLMFEISANRFLHSMVRLLVGTMIDVGSGKLSVEDFRRIFTAKDVREASPAARAEGLFLWCVEYGKNHAEKPAVMAVEASNMH
ncbi:MAG: tRNA pseudouridine(38-40) synthase TruA [Chlorobiales bacterium]|nr:tRNA pseudouridine(38-40) synthase TruA [Chlorobiales bacterium]